MSLQQASGRCPAGLSALISKPRKSSGRSPSNWVVFLGIIRGACVWVNSVPAEAAGEWESLVG